MSVKKKTAAKKKPVVKKTSTKKSAPKKAAVKKSAVKKAPVKNTVKKKNPVKKTAVKKASPTTNSSIGLHGVDPYKEKRGEEYMNPKQVQHFKDILLNWKRELMEEVDRTVHHMQDDAANFPDPNDRASQESEFALELRTRDRERKLIKKIDESLIMLESDDFGFCDVCGIEIGIRRLEARPTATQCIDCKTLDEIREKQLKS